MLQLNLTAINWWAVLAATAAAFVFGGLWYGALFGKRRPALYGFSEDHLKRLAARQAQIFGVIIVAEFITAAVLALLVVNLQITTAGPGLQLGGLVWLGFAAATHVTTHVASGWSVGGFVVDSLHQLICLLIMGAILGGWR